MKADAIIIGGGLAGLSAANRLTELGLIPLVIEAGVYPAHKICGEFFSPESISLLNHWGLHPVPVHQTHIHTASNSLTFQFPRPAGSLSHFQVDPHLAQRAITNGAIIRTKTQVTQLIPRSKTNDWHTVHLSTQEVLETPLLIVATGRLPQTNAQPPHMRYLGIKAHFEGITLKNSLEMFSFPGAYAGLSPIENNQCNMACLANIDSFQNMKTPDEIMDDLKQQHPTFNRLLSEGRPLFKEWMWTKIPSFGLKQTPPWPNAYFIGDAAGTIPPASGNGLTLALIGGYLAAEYALRKEAEGFKKTWEDLCRSQIRWAKLLHFAMLHPGWGNRLIQFNSCIPSLTKQLFDLTRFHLREPLSELNRIQSVA